MNQFELMMRILPELSDEAAFELLQLTENLFTAATERYGGQVRNYLQEHGRNTQSGFDFLKDDPEF